MGAEGWGAVLGVAAGLAGLTVVEPLGAAWRGLVEGRLESLELGGKLEGEPGLAGVVAAGYLGRSASCLTRLDMRCPPLARSLALPRLSQPVAAITYVYISIRLFYLYGVATGPRIGS